MTNPILVSVDGRGPSFEAVEIVGSWNGWAIPRVTVEVARAIAADLEREKDFGPAAEVVRAVIRDEARPDGTVVLNLGLVFSKVEPPEEEKPETRSLPQALGYVAAAGVSNLVRWAMTWAASEIARENAKAQAEQNAKRDAERAALVKEIRKRRAETDPALAFQLAPGELSPRSGWTGMPGEPLQVVPWSELEQIPIGGYGHEAKPTEGVVAAYAGRVFVVVQLRRHEGWDPVWCLLSLSGDVCGYTGGA